MNKTAYLLTAFLLLAGFVAKAEQAGREPAAPAECVAVLSAGNAEVGVNAKGALVLLRGKDENHNYASGGPLWRLYYETHEEMEIPVYADEQQDPVIRANASAIVIRYDKLVCRGKTLPIGLTLTITAENGDIRFASRVENNLPHSIVRELHYPLVRNCAIPKGHKLILADAGGRIYPDPVAGILKHSNNPPYKSPGQYYRQYDLYYGAGAAMNFFLLAGDQAGLYFGCHDPGINETWHGLRLYPDSKGDFSIPEFGLYRYPHCLSGDTWEDATCLISPYDGTWHKAADKYRAWVDATWWDKIPAPQWAVNMRSWQRVIFKHQYGEYFFRYPDMYGRVSEVGKDVGADVLHLFGWWNEGMDRGNPDYSPDPSQGGDKGLAEAIARYKKTGQYLILYYNGQLIDANSKFYRSGMGSKVSCKDASGMEYLDHYFFTGLGTYTAGYQAVTFVVADTRQPVWREKLAALADRAYSVGANGVFFDQLGKGFSSFRPWDRSGEFPIPDIHVARDKGETLHYLRDYVKGKYGNDFGFGTELINDYTNQYADYVLSYSITYLPNNFIDLYRYTFPEVKMSCRHIRDDADDIEHRNNICLSRDLFNDIEVFRCRDLIDKTPKYQAYLRQVNDIRLRYADCIMQGRYRDVLGFENTNPEVDAKAFVGKNRMAVIAINETSAKPQETRISVPGYKYAGHSSIGDATVTGDKVTLGKHGVAVLIYDKQE